MNSQISAANDFWLKFLASYTPRAIPVFMDKLDVVVSYSDGEGADAGLGVAVWSSRCPNGPLAAFCKIPEPIRRLWSRQKEEGFNDIFLIEAIGPLSILTTFPKILKGSLWLHYIDNVASEYSLVKGSSSIRSGDIVVGETWRMIQKLGIYAYFDRVASESNPVDGLSRGRREGPWQRIVKAKLPTNLEELLAAERSESDLD